MSEGLPFTQRTAVRRTWLDWLLRRRPPVNALVELVKGTAKIAIISVAGWLAVRPSLDGLDMMPLTEPAATAPSFRSTAST